MHLVQNRKEVYTNWVYALPDLFSYNHMKHNIKGLDMVLTPAISGYLEKRIAHLDKFISPEHKQEVMCYAEIGKSTKHHKKGDVFAAELTVHVGGKSFRAKTEEYDLYAAIDRAVEEMTEELTSFKDKEVSFIRRHGARLKALLKGLYNGRE